MLGSAAAKAELVLARHFLIHFHFGAQVTERHSAYKAALASVPYGIVLVRVRATTPPPLPKNGIGGGWI